MPTHSTIADPTGPGAGRPDSSHLVAGAGLARFAARAARPASLVFLAAATIASFAGVLRNGWVLLDDPIYVYENVYINRGITWEGLRWSLHRPHGGNWHPLTSFSHMLDVQLFGLRPAGHHAVNLALHVLNALLLVVVLSRLTGAWWRSFLVGCFFAIHPLRVESVAWVSERKDVLSGCFFLLTLGAYGRWAERPTRSGRALMIAMLVLGLMAKPMLVTLPFVLLLLDFWPLRRPAHASDARGRAAGSGAIAGSWRAGASRHGAWLSFVREKWLLFALAAASAAVTVVVQRQSGAVAPTELLPIGRRLCNALITCWRYIGMTFWPSGLIPFYPHSSVANVPGAMAAAAGLAAVSVFLIRRAGRQPGLLVGWLWYLGMLIPVIGLLQVGSQAYADRYTYLPTIGLLIALVWAGADIVSRSRAGRIAAASACAVALCALGFATARQVALWKDTRILFTHVLAISSHNPVANMCVGDMLLQDNKVEEAIPHYRDAVRVAARMPDGYDKLGVALGAIGRYDESAAQLQEAIRLSDTAEFRHNLGYTYNRQGRLDDAVHEYEAALRLDPDFFMALVHLGGAYGRKGRLPESEALLRRAVKLAPDDIEIHRLLAVTLTLEAKVEEAIAEYRTILRKNPDDLDALNNVAWIRATHAEATHRNGLEAVREAEHARDKSPEPVAVLYSTLAAAYAEAGRFREAVDACERAIQLAKGDSATADAERYSRQLESYRAGKPFHFSR